LILLAAILNGGCVSEQQSEFRGTIACGEPVTNAPSAYPIGFYFQCLDPKYADAMTGFGVSQSSIFFVHDRQKYVDKDYRLSNGDVNAVYITWIRREVG
jgi:hypothetical protein